MEILFDGYLIRIEKLAFNEFDFDSLQFRKDYLECIRQLCELHKT